MRALTLHRPWDWAMAHGGKQIENRPWKPYQSVIGQRIALHAGAIYSDEGAGFIDSVLGDGSAPSADLSRPFVVVATTRVLGWLRVGRANGHLFLDECSDLPLDHAAAAMKSPWLFGPYGWVVADTITLPEPVFCAGKQGLWALPAAVDAEVLRQESLARRSA
jgi:hypothetical protein